MHELFGEGSETDRPPLTSAVVVPFDLLKGDGSGVAGPDPQGGVGNRPLLVGVTKDRIGDQLRLLRVAPVVSRQSDVRPFRVGPHPVRVAIPSRLRRKFLGVLLSVRRLHGRSEQQGPGGDDRDDVETNPVGQST